MAASSIASPKDGQKSRIWPLVPRKIWWPILWTFFLTLLPKSTAQTEDVLQARVERHRRQFARYICGIPPYLFHSDWPCPIWGLCANHGFTTNMPCTNNQTCVESNPGTECVQGTCCTLPKVITQQPAIAPTSWPGSLTLTWPGSTPVVGLKSGANGNGWTTCAFSVICPLLILLMTRFLR